MQWERMNYETGEYEPFEPGEDPRAASDGWTSSKELVGSGVHELEVYGRGGQLQERSLHLSHTIFLSFAVGERCSFEPTEMVTGISLEEPRCMPYMVHAWDMPQNEGACAVQTGVTVYYSSRKRFRRVCRHCGMYQVLETHESGKTIASLAYEVADDASRAWIRRLKRSSLGEP